MNNWLSANPFENPLPSGDYKVAFLVRGRKDVSGQPFTLEAAKRTRKMYARQGMTAWVETAHGEFVPVKGAMKRPLSVDDVRALEIAEMMHPKTAIVPVNLALPLAEQGYFKIVSDAPSGTEREVSLTAKGRRFLGSR